VSDRRSLGTSLAAETSLFFHPDQACPWQVNYFQLVTIWFLASVNRRDFLSLSHPPDGSRRDLRLPSRLPFRLDVDRLPVPIDRHGRAVGKHGAFPGELLVRKFVVRHLERAYPPVQRHPPPHLLEVGWHAAPSQARRRWRVASRGDRLRHASLSRRHGTPARKARPEWRVATLGSLPLLSFWLNRLVV